MKYVLNFIIAITVVFGPMVASAATGQSFGKVKVLLLNDTSFGGCMAYLEKMPANNVCGNAGAPGYVTFMCDGTNGVSKSGAAQRLDVAQMAYVLDKNVSVSITDAIQSPEGYCYVYDIRAGS